VVLDRLKRKFERAKSLVPKAVFAGKSAHDVGVVSLGSCDGAVNEALDILRRRGMHLDYMRVRGFPFGKEVEEFLASHAALFVVEQNRDAQLRGLLTLETAVEKAKLHSILHYSGLPISSSVIVEGILAELGDAAKVRSVV
jgi:2-oxoglutarate ferredoxin oxidoreductase subunit alpha